VCAFCRRPLSGPTCGLCVLGKYCQATVSGSDQQAFGDLAACAPSQSYLAHPPSPARRPKQPSGLSRRRWLVRPDKEHQSQHNDRAAGIKGVSVDALPLSTLRRDRWRTCRSSPETAGSLTYSDRTWPVDLKQRLVPHQVRPRAGPVRTAGSK